MPEWLDHIGHHGTIHVCLNHHCSTGLQFERGREQIRSFNNELGRTRRYEQIHQGRKHKGDEREGVLRGETGEETS